MVVLAVKSVAASKFATSAVVPDEYLTTLVVAPLTLFVKVDASEVLIACASARVTEPAITDDRFEFGVPRVGVTPLILDDNNVASSDGTKGPLYVVVGEPFAVSV